MNQSAKKKHHEEARKKHKHDQQAHAREAAKQKPSRLPQVLLIGGVLFLIAFVILIAFN